MPPKKTSCIIRIFRVPSAHNQDKRTKRLPSIEIPFHGLPSLKKAARDTLTKRGYKIRSMCFGAHDDLVVYVEE